MKTVKELIEYLQQFPSNTKIRKTGWDCYNDEPYEGEVKPYTLETIRQRSLLKSKRKIQISMRLQQQ